jgi:hypothetical protein
MSLAEISASSSRKPSSRTVAAGNTLCSAWLSIRSESRLTTSLRAIAIATPSSAICASSPSSQAGSARPSDNSRLRLRMARS